MKVNIYGEKLDGNIKIKEENLALKEMNKRLHLEDVIPSKKIKTKDKRPLFKRLFNLK